MSWFKKKSVVPEKQPTVRDKVVVPSNIVGTVGLSVFVQGVDAALSTVASELFELSSDPALSYDAKCKIINLMLTLK